MKSSENFFSKNKDALHSKTMKGGGYSVLLIVVLLAILIVFNILVGALPSTWTHYDMSASRLYSVSSATKATVQNLDRDVTIYWVTQAGKENAVIEKLLDVYDAKSSHLTVVKKNPDIYPTFTSQYTSSTVENNSLIVECGDKYRYIPYSSILTADYMTYYTTGSIAYEFDGEGLITSAIGYVTSDDMPKLYIITGHGEADLPTDFRTTIERKNIETKELNLINTKEIPEDANAVLVYSPSKDFSESDVKILREYLDKGGKLIVFCPPKLKDEQSFDVLRSLAADYGIKSEEGIVLEGSDSNAYQYYYNLLPKFGSSDIVSEMVEENEIVIVPIAYGMTIEKKPGIVTESLLNTTDTAYIKTIEALGENSEYEEGDPKGPFSLAVSAESTKTGASVIWVSSGMMMNDDVNSASYGANIDFAMSSISWMIGETEGGVSIMPKKIGNNSLTISQSQASFIKICMLGIIPAAYLVYGIDEVVRRKKKA